MSRLFAHFFATVVIGSCRVLKIEDEPRCCRAPPPVATIVFVRTGKPMTRPPSPPRQGRRPAPAKKIHYFQGSNKKHEFKTNDHVVYPTHGGRQSSPASRRRKSPARVWNCSSSSSRKDKMTLRVPTLKAKPSACASCPHREVVGPAPSTPSKGRARIKRTMWSRRAQKYQAKIDSGDLVSIAEVVRDLHRAGGQPEQSYSRTPALQKAPGPHSLRSGGRRKDRRAEPPSSASSGIR